MLMQRHRFQLCQANKIGQRLAYFLGFTQQRFKLYSIRLACFLITISNAVLNVAALIK